MKKLNVPELKQREMECGPTVLRMVLKYFGKDISEKEIIREIGGIKKYGVRTAKLADFAKKLGFSVECYSYNKKLSGRSSKVKLPRKSDIIKFLKNGLPVIITVRSFLLYGERPSKAGHFIVITKYKKGMFWYNDPNDGKSHRIGEDQLIFAWLNNVLDSSAYLLILKP